MKRHPGLVLLLVAITVCLYVAWDYLMPRQNSAAAAKEENVELTAAMIDAGERFVGNRDPYGMPKAGKEQADIAGRPSTMPAGGGSGGSLAGGASHVVAMQSAAMAARQAKARRELEESLLEGLTVEGTVISGESRSAIINGQTYREGESEPANSELPVWSVECINPHSVVVRSGAVSVELPLDAPSESDLQSKQKSPAATEIAKAAKTRKAAAGAAAQRPGVPSRSSHTRPGTSRREAIAP